MLMLQKVVLGGFLLFIAFLDYRAARDVDALARNHSAAWFVRLVGRSRTRPVLLVLAAFIAFIGVATIVMAVAGIKS